VADGATSAVPVAVAVAISVPVAAVLVVTVASAGGGGGHCQKSSNNEADGGKAPPSVPRRDRNCVSLKVRSFHTLRSTPYGEIGAQVSNSGDRKPRMTPHFC